MPLYYKYENLDDYFNSLDLNEIKILNHLDYTNEEHIKLVSSLSQQTIDGDTIHIDATCLCGNINGNYNAGNICPVCNTIVRDRTADFNPILWVKKPEQIHSFINPAFVAEFEAILHTKSGNISIFRWLTDNTYNPNSTIKKSPSLSRVISALNNMPVERDYNFFVQNIPEILSVLIASITNPDKTRMLLKLKDRYLNNIDLLHSNMLPILNKKFLLIERNSKGNYIDTTMFNLKDIILTLFRNMSSENISEKRLLISTANTIKKLADMYLKIHKGYFSTKAGLWRKLIGGLRGAFTFRNTIIPIPDKHDINSTILPWGSAIIVLEYYIVNILYKKGFTPLQIRQKLKSSVNNFDPDINECLDIILELAKKGMGGLYVHMLRNPSQSVYGSSVYRVSNIDRDPNKRGLRISGVIVGNGQGDFEMRFTEL